MQALEDLAFILVGVWVRLQVAHRSKPCREGTEMCRIRLEAWVAEGLVRDTRLMSLQLKENGKCRLAFEDATADRVGGHQ